MDDGAKEIIKLRLPNLMDCNTPWNKLSKAEREDHIDYLLSHLSAKEKEIENLTNWNTTLQQEIAKVAVYFNLPEDGKLFSEQVIECVKGKEVGSKTVG